jgi:hypothetical protein
MTEQYLAFYLIGCLLVVMLMLIHAIIYWSLSWLTKSGQAMKNAKKIMDPNETSTLFITFTFIIIDISLSWINVLIIPFQIIKGLVTALRESWSTPASVKTLRYPLKNNPDMTREAVWAHIVSILVLMTGQQPESDEIADGLLEIQNWYPSFDTSTALDQLIALSVVKL